MSKKIREPQDHLLRSAMSYEPSSCNNQLTNDCVYKFIKGGS